MRQAPRHASNLASFAVGRNDPKILQDFLAQKLSVSRRTAKAVIDGRNVWVDRKCVWIARYSLETGDVVEMPRTVANAAVAQGGTRAGAAREVERGPRHVRVLWQDDAYLVCDKPAGLVSCDDPRSVESVLRTQESLPNLEAVHRLDRDTTGCLLFAKNHAAFLAAVEVFKTHSVLKTYHAIAAGDFRYDYLKIDTPLDGETAVTKIAREATGDDSSLLRVRIDTGRTNQIRRHLASVRHPILGDRTFGLKNARDARLMTVPRQMLHASTLELPNPLSKKDRIKVHSPLPADFRAALKAFGMGKKRNSSRKEEKK